MDKTIKLPIKINRDPVMIRISTHSKFTFWCDIKGTRLSEDYLEYYIGFPFVSIEIDIPNLREPDYY